MILTLATAAIPPLPLPATAAITAAVSQRNKLNFFYLTILKKIYNFLLIKSVFNPRSLLTDDLIF